MSWSVLYTATAILNQWVCSNTIQGTVFRLKHISNSPNKANFRAVLGQAFIENSNITVFDTKLLTYKDDAEAYILIKPIELANRMLAIRRLDNNAGTWDIVVEVLNGMPEYLTLPLYINQIDNLEDILDGKAEKATTSLIQSTITVLTNEVTTKASNSRVDDIENSLLSKANTVDLNALQLIVEDKADSTELDALVEVVSTKAGSIEIGLLEDVISTKANNTDLDALVVNIATKANTASLLALESVVSTKADSTDITALENIIVTKASNNDLAILEAALYTKASSSSLATLQTIVDTKASITDVNDLTVIVNGKASNAQLSILTNLVNTKVDATVTNALQDAVNTKASITELNTLQTVVNSKASNIDLAILNAAIATKANSSDLSLVQTSVSNKLSKASNLLDIQDVDIARSNINAAKNGVNNDITKLTAILTPTNGTANTDVATTQFTQQLYKPAFMLHANAVQTISTTITKIIFDTKSLDTNNASANSEFIVPTGFSGLYSLFINLYTLKDTTNGTLELQLRVNNIVVNRTFFRALASVQNTVPLLTLRALTALDIVTVWFRTSATNVSVNATDSTYSTFHGYRLGI